MNKKIISLIGMTGTGKTTVGQKTADDMKTDFYDLDKIIEESECEKIKDIFDKYGESEFRRKETHYLREIISEIKRGIQKQNNSVKAILSCGGGIVTVEENIKILKDNTITIWIKREVCDIIKDEDIFARPPINNSIENYTRIYEKRKTLYEKTADFTINNFDVDVASTELRKISNFFKGTEK